MQLLYSLFWQKLKSRKLKKYTSEITKNTFKSNLENHSILSKKLKGSIEVFLMKIFQKRWFFFIFCSIYIYLYIKKKGRQFDYIRDDFKNLFVS